MATSSDGIATYGDLNKKIKCAFANMSDKTKCATKESLQSWLWTVSTSEISYSNDRCVQYSDVSVNTTYSHAITVQVHNGRGSGSLGVHWIDVNLIAPDGQTTEVAGADWNKDISNDDSVEKTLYFTIPSKIGTHTVNLGANNYKIQVRVGETSGKRAFRCYAYKNDSAGKDYYYYKNEETDTKIGQITFPFNYVDSVNTYCFLGGYNISTPSYVYVNGSNT